MLPGYVSNSQKRTVFQKLQFLEAVGEYVQVYVLGFFLTTLQIAFKDSLYRVFAIVHFPEFLSGNDNVLPSWYYNKIKHVSCWDTLLSFFLQCC